MARRTDQVCKICSATYTLDTTGVIAAAELEVFVSAHIPCGGALLISHRDE